MVAQNETPASGSDTGWKEEVVQFFGQIHERIQSLQADRIRFEADGENIFLRIYSKREILKSIHLQSGAFEQIWQWMNEDGKLKYLPTIVDPPTFQVCFPYNKGFVSVLGQRSKTLRLKSSLLLWDFTWHATEEEEIPIVMEEAPLPLPSPAQYVPVEPLTTGNFDDDGDELDKLQRKARIDSGALQRIPRFRKSSIPPTQGPEGKPVVLIVEDQPDQRQLMKIALQKQNYIVQEAKNGQEALDLLAKSLPDGIVTDLMMPVLDGSELVRRVKRDPNLLHIPVMVYTVISDQSVEYDILDLGADDYCEKTASPKLFLKRLERLVRRTQSGAFVQPKID